MGTINIPCIGHLSSDEIFSLSGLNYWDFQWKSVLDIGCWFSDTLSSIWDNSTPLKLVGLDPIFTSLESLDQAVQDTKKHIQGLIDIFSLIPKTRLKLEKIIDSISTFTRENEKIRYIKDFGAIKHEKFDFIFISYVLTHLLDSPRKELIKMAVSQKKVKGVIIIVDRKSVLKNIDSLPLQKVTGNRGVSCIKI